MSLENNTVTLRLESLLISCDRGVVRKIVQPAIDFAYTLLDFHPAVYNRYPFMSVKALNVSLELLAELMSTALKRPIDPKTIAIIKITVGHNRRCFEIDVVEAIKGNDLLNVRTVSLTEDIDDATRHVQ